MLSLQRSPRWLGEKTSTMGSWTPSSKAWPAACAFLLILLLVQYQSILPIAPKAAHFSDIFSKAGEWEYIPARDSLNPGLSTAQCDAAFPELYHEIDRAVEYWRDERHHQIGPNDLVVEGRPDGAYTVMIHENNVVVTNDNGGVKGSRRRSGLSMLYRALQGATMAGEMLPTVEFSLSPADESKLPEDLSDTTTILGYARDTQHEHHQRVWVYPDFNRYAHPPQASGFLEMIRRAKERDAPLSKKIAKVFWRGVTWSNWTVRKGLLAATKDKSWADVEEVVYEKHTPNIMKNEDMCRYMFTTYTEGVSWSGRMKYMLNCNSIPIVHELRWHAFYHHLLIPDGPNQNYIKVARNFSDLEEKVAPFLADAALAQRVADNAVATFRDRYKSPAAESCYWRRLIRGYAQVSFRPDPYVKVKSNVSGIEFEATEIRGYPYEAAL